MRRLLVAAGLLGVGLLTTRSADGAITAVCCACINTAFSATTSQAAQPEVAVFCAEATTDHDDLTDRCVDVGPTYKLLCIADEPGPSCAKQFADEHDIICPAVGAPVAGGSGLAALVVALSGLGALAVGRRLRG